MLNRRSVEAVAAAAAGPHEIRPLYGSYCFSRIPWTIEAALTGEPNPRTLPPDAFGALAGRRPDTVVLLFVDAFGWRFFEEFVKSTPALARFLRDGTVSKLTALFPSTTSAPCRLPALRPDPGGERDLRVVPVRAGRRRDESRLSSARGLGRRGGTGSPSPPRRCSMARPCTERLAAQGVRSFSVTPAEFTPSPFNDAFTRGTTDVPYKGLSRGLNALARLVADPGGPGPRLIHYYYGGIDRIAHRSGPDSPELRRSVRRFFGELERRFFSVLERARDGAAHGERPHTGGRHGSGAKADAGPAPALSPASAPASARKPVSESASEPPRETCVVLTADHGMIGHDPARAVYLNRVLPEVEGWLERGPGGRLKVPAGSPRDFFLHLREDRFDEAVAAIRSTLNGVAEVRPVRDLVAAGYFGDAPPSRRFLERVGNAVILPHPGRAVWWYEEGRFKSRHPGDHGGLSPEEMEIPFGVLSI